MDNLQDNVQQQDSISHRQLESQLRALSGQVQAANALLEDCELSLHHRIFEKVRMYEQQGNYTLAEVTLASGPDLCPDTPIAVLTRALLMYIGCFTKGAWLEALRVVCLVFAELIAQNGELTFEWLAVSLSSR